MFVLALLPAIFILWIIGWSLYCAGKQQTSKGQTHKAKQEDVFQMAVNLLQEEM
jgi:hypothetical protein